MTARILSRRNRSVGSQQPPSQARGGGPPEHPRPTATTQAATARSDSVQHLSAVHQRVFRLQQVGQAVELLEPGIGVMLAVRGMTGNLDRDDVLRDRADRCVIMVVLPGGRPTGRGSKTRV